MYCISYCIPVCIDVVESGVGSTIFLDHQLTRLEVLEILHH